MFGEKNQPLENGLKLFYKLWSENSGSSQINYGLETIEQQSFSIFNPPEHVSSGADMTYNPSPSGTVAPRRQRLRNTGKQPP